METIKSLIKFIDHHPTVTILAAWFVYRMGVWNERKNILKALEEELDLQKFWLRTPWPKSEIKNISYLVFKIGTTAVDNAISRGTALFLNQNTMKSLVIYRQTVSSLNQLIDRVQYFQSNIELWDNSKKTNDVEQRALSLINEVHIVGIGDKNQPRAHLAFTVLLGDLEKEKNSKIMPIIWFWTNINPFRLKEHICKYL